MSNLRNLIKQSKAMKRDYVAFTLRMPKELHSFVDELVEQLGLSKQDVLLRLIEEGAGIADDELKLSETEEYAEDCSYHLLNTNKRHSIDDHERMLADGVAAAFYDPWKYHIDRIKTGDIVFLYENGVGIVAYGKGTGETRSIEHNGDKDECRYQTLEGFKKLARPLKASEIKKVLNRNVVFLRTMTGMEDGQKLLGRIAEMEGAPAA